jgi:hypothetical protein
MYRSGEVSRGRGILVGLVITVVMGSVRPVAAQSETQHAWLLKQGRIQRLQQQAEREVALVLARRLGLPPRTVREDGTVVEVQRVEEGLPIFYATQNVQEARSISASRVWPGSRDGYALTGNGVRVGIWDAGTVLADHQELAGRVSFVDGASVVASHATHVSGTIAAAGVNLDARGIAYAAQLVSYDWAEDRAEMAAAAAEGLRVSNHSYGQLTGWVNNVRGDGKWAWLGDASKSRREDYRFGYYDGVAADWDAIAYHAPHYLILKAASNDRGQGPPPGEAHWVIDRRQSQWVLSTDVRDQDGGDDGFDTIIDAGVAKNILPVGAVFDVEDGYRTPEDVKMTPYSGWGPTDDGRIKPDLVTDGAGVYSTVSRSPAAYGTSSGTSMAVASATGAAALLLEHERQVRGDRPFLSSTLKALLIHTADEAGPAPGPDYMYGWGLVNLLSAAQVMKADAEVGGAYSIREHTLTLGAAAEWTFVSDGTTPFRATIAWNDPPGVPAQPTLNNRSPKLANDLDLEIIGPSGEVHFPWVLDPEHPAARATRGVNQRDNVEQVHHAAPKPGLYTVRVRFSQGNGEANTQAFSLILTGVVPPESRKISLEPGWNLVASPVWPVDNRLDALLGSAAQDIVLVKAEDGGQYKPGESVDEIGAWNPVRSYLIYAQSAVELTFEGPPLPPSTPVALHEGWNQVPYWGLRPRPLREALASIRDQLVLVKDASGHVYFPEDEIDSIGMLQPNDGYMILLKAPACLSGRSVVHQTAGLRVEQAGGKATFLRCRPTVLWVLFTKRAWYVCGRLGIL